ncbi:hypothetical protein CERZMDRAFT_98553 [Cercospora zeae-maydis SCOH1-5]|uniref:Uncharacterized protein n=1 Tax=Cercospora zeae-maydis SCOH1-5 TaxID=717836 RepID=A0A6A6FCN3_9PEZI|nr:hypothetical protein CERZMDRAFT_98553 [Cercospora zeae-maydis SCOH1-5]
MSLTLSQPYPSDFGSKYTHDFNTRFSLAKSRFSPKARVTDSPSPVSLPRVGVGRDDKMSTPHHSHRGLPPPAAMALPEPARPGPSSALSSQLGAIPEPPRQWAGQEDQMRNWLAAKAEEDKRKQEEEKTRQETLRLEQRRIESEMLRESLRAGVPPAMVPMIYAGIGGGNLFNISMDWLQQYAGQLQVSQQQLQQASPDMRRDARLIGPPAPGNYAAGQQPQALTGQQTNEPQPPPGSLQTTFPAYQAAPPRQQHQHNASVPRSATHTQLPKLTTNEMYVHQPPAPSTTSHPLQQSQTVQQEQATSSPSIYFHHWVPPQEAKPNQPPQTPANRNEPSSAHPGSNARDDYKESPRKRKAAGEHQANPPPPTGPQYTSPSFSTASSGSRQGGRGHVRTRSTASWSRESDSRPESSYNRRDEPPPTLPKQRDSGQQDEIGSSQGGGESHGPASHAKHESSRAPPGAPSVVATDLSRFREAHPAEPRPGSS